MKANLENTGSKPIEQEQKSQDYTYVAALEKNQADQKAGTSKKKEKLDGADTIFENSKREK